MTGASQVLNRIKEFSFNDKIFIVLFKIFFLLRLGFDMFIVQRFSNLICLLSKGLVL